MKVRRSVRRERRPSALAFLVSSFSSPFLRIISSSMVMSTRPGFSASVAAPCPASASLTAPCPPSVILSRARAWALRVGWSRRPRSPPQPVPVSYFLSLRDSCFFFSEEAAFTLADSAGGAGPCLCCDPSFFFLPCLLKFRLKTRRATRNLIR